MFQVVRNSPKPLGDQLVEEVTRLIESGRLPEGFRLPSVRQLARRAGVSAYTVTTAFQRLSAKGLIQARAGSGYFVARMRRQAARVELGPAPSLDPVLGFTRNLLEQENVVVPAGSGFLPPSWLADGIPSSSLSRFGKSGAAAEPATLQGDPQLRELLAERLRLANVPVAAQHVVITFGASHAFDLIATTLLTAGDAVVVEDPAYFVLPAQLRARGLRLVPVPRLSDGTDLDALEAAAQLHKPRMLFTQTLLHNPTGTSASAARCHGILKIAERHNFLVAEDHVYTDLASPHMVSLAQIDELQRVIYVGSFTKVLGPGLRIGFVATRDELLRPLVEGKLLGVLSGSALSEFVLREVLDGGKYRRHVERLRDRVAKARAAASRLLVSAGLTVEISGGEGIFVWARLPSQVDPDRLSLDAQAQGILLAKGALFSPTGQCGDCLRFNVAYAADPVLIEFLSARTGAAHHVL
jgi:DNA-binding transcriptional MocR family regulator